MMSFAYNMQISRFNYNTYYSTYNNKKYNNYITPFNKNTKIPFDKNISFYGHINKNTFIKFFNIDPIYAFKNFSKDEYIKLSEKQKNKLRENFRLLEAENPKNLKSIGEIHAYAANCIKKTFDERFGENNYVVILIGRSLSSIGKSLGVKIGENNVINVPMSNSYRYKTDPTSLTEYRHFINNLKRDDGIQTMKKFLELHNLSRKDIETSGKNYILMDYCFKGNSLIGAEQFFKSEEVWGNKNNNIFAVDFLQLLNKYDEESITPKIKLIPEGQNIFNRIQSKLYSCGYKKYSTINKAPELRDTMAASKENQNIFRIPKETKLVWFNLIDSIMKEKGDFQVKIKKNLFDDELFSQKAKNQKIEPWHNSESQYINDLTNILNEINKILIKHNISTNSKQKNINHTFLDEINGVYKYLCYCFQNRKTSLQSRFDFYEIQDDIKELINKINADY